MIKIGDLMSLCLRGTSLHTLAYPLCIQPADFAPEFFPLCIEINKCRCKTELIHGSQLAPDFFLNVHADDDDAIPKVGFKLVHDGLQLRADYSIG